MKKLFIINIFFFLVALPLRAEESGSGVYHLKGQYAGELGVASLGFGKRFTSWYKLTGMYGYVPAWDDAHAIHTIALKQDFKLWQINSNLQSYFDLTILHAFGNLMQPTLKEEGQSLWDSINNSSEAVLALGGEYRFKNVALYSEIGVLGHWLFYYLGNTDTVTLADSVTITFGFNYYF